MLRILLHVMFIFTLVTSAYAQSNTKVSVNTAEPVLSTSKSNASKLSADHSKFKELQGPFKTGSDVTKACLSCHTEAGDQVMHSLHWTWDTINSKTGQNLGKKNVLNSFCGNLSTNEPRCTSCHAGYGWEDTKTFDFTDQTKVDCLACHDTTQEYIKWPTKAGHPLYEPLTQANKMIPYAESLIKKENGMFTHQPPDLAKIAQNVGRPSNANCGTCHFYGGGGDNVKHGDLSSALINPSPHVDVHMSPDGADMVCADCHAGTSHQWAGSRYHGTITDNTIQKSGMRNTEILACNSCHTSAPHNNLTLVGNKLNDHTDRIACQTCHIPTFAKGDVGTKMWWDWSTGGKLKDGKPFSEQDEKGRDTYLTIKGDFEWDDDVVPEYAFWNGIVESTLLTDKIDPTTTVGVNRIGGGPDQADSKIFPFKLMLGRQAYDKVHKNLLLNNVYGPEGDSAFWSNYDWEKSIAAGMASTDVPYSGEYGFVDTEMWWPTTHMVAPADEALTCDQCHAKDGRLTKVSGIYLPGRDEFEKTDRIGLWLLALSLIGILIHASIRIVTKRRTN